MILKDLVACMSSSTSMLLAGPPWLKDIHFIRQSPKLSSHLFISYHQNCWGCSQDQELSIISMKKAKYSFSEYLAFDIHVAHSCMNWRPIYLQGTHRSSFTFLPSTETLLGNWTVCRGTNSACISVVGYLIGNREKLILYILDSRYFSRHRQFKTNNPN